MPNLPMGEFLPEPERKVQLQRKISARKQVSFDEKASVPNRPVYNRTPSGENAHPALERRRTSSVKRGPSATEEEAEDQESYVIKSNRADAVVYDFSCQTLDEVCTSDEVSTSDEEAVVFPEHSSISESGAVTAHESPRKQSNTKDFWDAFAEDDTDDDVFLEHQICYTPCDVIKTTLQVTAAGVLLFLTMMSLSAIQLSIVLLTRASKDKQNESLSQMVILLGSLIPALISAPHSLVVSFFCGKQRSLRLPSLLHTAVIAISVVFDVYNLTLLSVHLLPKLDVCEGLLVLAASSCCSHSHKLVLSTPRDCLKDTRSVFDRSTLAIIIQIGTCLCLAIPRIADGDFHTALLIPVVLITSCLGEMLNAYVSGSQRMRSSTSLASATLKIFITAAAVCFIANTASTSVSLVPLVPAYIQVAGAGLAILPVVFYVLVMVLRFSRLSKGASLTLSIAVPLTLLASLVSAWIWSPEFCLQASADGSCSTSLVITKGIIINGSVILFLVGWFWSYVTLTLATDSGEKNLSSLLVYKAENFAISLFNTSSSHTEKLHKLSTSNLLPIYNKKRVIDLGQGQVEVKAYTSDEEVTPKVYLCATMWHENKPEMKQLLTSILKLDEFQCLKRQTNALLSQAELDLTDPDYFEFEAHIMFDDAMSWDEKGERTINHFVSEFVKLVEETGNELHGPNSMVNPPLKFPAPYGGKITFSLPGENLLVVHLKDKQKIRNKKRWSMIQYMYYLLGYKLLSEYPEDYGKLSHPGIPCKTKSAADNTFLLTVDGDVQFEPDSILQLMKSLRKNEEVGVVCGRIHPMGSGFLVWYQRFEYAISHWLHKTAEHVMGVVLCTPGAFSMFKASALMDRNIIKSFTKEAKSGRDVLQYEQGEDRWLCSLLFQQGHRCEYIATASARTFAPETLNEFFNQRRRWALSTLVNHYDLLLKWRNSYLKNRDISLSYVLFEAVLLLTNILGPAFVLILVAYANTTVFGVDVNTSYLISVVPPLFYALLCLFISKENQVNMAYILSLYYGCLMAFYFVLNVSSMVGSSLLTPLGVLMILLGLLFILTAILHPRESSDLLPVALYYLMAPTTYVILMIYSVLNMNNVSWGTREVTSSNKKAKSGKNKPRDDLVDPAWVESPVLKDLELSYLDENELIFWRRLIDRYLKPHAHSEDTKAALTLDLLTMRNRSAVAYFSVNAAILCICYLVQKHPGGVQVHLAGSADDADVEPVALMCVVIFGLLALTQFVCLIWQRANRMILTCASMLRLRKSSTQTPQPEVETAKYIVEHLKKLNLVGSGFKKLPPTDRSSKPRRVPPKTSKLRDLIISAQSSAEKSDQLMEV